MLIIWKFPRSIVGRTKHLRGPHAAREPRVWGLVYNICVKQHEWKRSIATNKAYFLQPILPRKCADHLRCEISSRAFATFQNKQKTRKQEEAICIKCVLCSYFDKILYTYSGFCKENVRHLVWTCRDPIFSDFRDPIFNSRDPIQAPKTP